MEHKTVRLSQCKMHYIEASPCHKRQGNTLVFLHGFPEAWFAWEKQIRHFSKAYRVIVPDLPGYNLSEKVDDVSFYQVPNLIKTIEEFVETIAEKQKVVLIAHDWGGAIAWPLAAFHPQLFSQLIILNAAHPSTFTREMINNKEQRRRSDYIHELIDDNAITNLRKNNFAYLQKTIWESMASSNLTPESQERYITAWGQEGALECMLNYYKAMPQLAPSIKASEENVSEKTQKMTIPNIRISLPTLVLWGEQDKAFVVDVLDDLHTYVSDLEIKKFKKATHWLHHEIPTEVNKAIEDWLKARNDG